jgi:trimeric autotransporter adhesin
VKDLAASTDEFGQIAVQLFVGAVNSPSLRGIEIIESNNPSPVLQIDAGGPATGTWLADADYTGGSTSSTTATINTSHVTLPAPASVYQTERRGSFTYTLPGLTAGGTYTVNLHFAETYWKAAGKRLFNVSINGASVLSNFDVFSAAGGEDIAVVEPFTATASPSGTITVKFSPGTADIPMVSGIEIVQ